MIDKFRLNGVTYILVVDNSCKSCAAYEDASLCAALPDCSTVEGHCWKVYEEPQYLEKRIEALEKLIKNQAKSINELRTRFLELQFRVDSPSIVYGPMHWPKQPGYNTMEVTCGYAQNVN